METDQQQRDKDDAQAEGIDQKAAFGLAVLGKEKGSPKAPGPFVPLLLSCPAPAVPLQASGMPVQILVIAQSV